MERKIQRLLSHILRRLAIRMSGFRIRYASITYIAPENSFQTWSYNMELFTWRLLHHVKLSIQGKFSYKSMLKLLGNSYVWNMNKNLISLGVLISKNLQIILAYPSLKITKCALVVMKDTRKNLLYLHSNRIIGGVIVALYILGTNTDISRLQHMRLVHAEESVL